jgi:hypothetical protein
VARDVFSHQDGDQRETDYKAQLAIVASAHHKPYNVSNGLP